MASETTRADKLESDAEDHLEIDLYSELATFAQSPSKPPEVDRIVLQSGAAARQERSAPLQTPDEQPPSVRVSGPLIEPPVLRQDPPEQQADAARAHSAHSTGELNYGELTEI